MDSLIEKVSNEAKDFMERVDKIRKLINLLDNDKAIIEILNLLLDELEEVCKEALYRSGS